MSDQSSSTSDLPPWWHDFADAASGVVHPRVTPQVTWLTEAAAGRTVLVTATPAGWLDALSRPNEFGGSDVEMTTDAGSPGLAVVSPGGLPRQGTTIDLAFVDDVLLEVEDAGNLLERLVSFLSGGSELRAAVSVGPVRSPAVKRSLGPASLIGLLEGYLAVRSLFVRDGVMYAVGARDDDAGQRAAAAWDALSGAQGDIDHLLVAGFVATRDLASARAQFAGWRAHAKSLRKQLEACLAGSREAAARAQKQVARLEETTAGLQARVDRAETQVVELSDEVSSLATELATERRRLEAVYASHWWRLGQVIRLVRHDPRRAAGTLWRFLAEAGRAAFTRPGAHNREDR